MKKHIIYFIEIFNYLWKNDSLEDLSCTDNVHGQTVIKKLWRFTTSSAFRAYLLFTTPKENKSGCQRKYRVAVDTHQKPRG